MVRFGRDEEHSWNKIKIDGQWYNFDATFDHEYIMDGDKPRYMFRTDRFLKHDLIEGRRKEISGPKSTKNYTSERIIAIIKKAIQTLKQTKKALPQGSNFDPAKRTKKPHTWDLEMYGTTKEEYNKKTENNNIQPTIFRETFQKHEK